MPRNGMLGKWKASQCVHGMNAGDAVETENTFLINRIIDHLQVN